MAVGKRRLTFDSSSPSSNFILLVSDVILCACRDTLSSVGKYMQGPLLTLHHVTNRAIFLCHEIQQDRVVLFA